MQKTLITHAITLEQAVALTTRYRENIPVDMPICETFEKDSVLKLLEAEGAEKFRIYYGEKDNGQVCAVLVAADAEDRDILPDPEKTAFFSEGENDGYILEDSFRCPELCPPESPLNH